jgi:hypothetical protein
MFKGKFHPFSLLKDRQKTMVSSFYIGCLNHVEGIRARKGAIYQPVQQSLWQNKWII